MDQILNKENTGVYLPSNPMKNGVPLSNTAFKQTVKKSVLGKLDNVMHQTPGITPFKSNNAVKLEGSMAKLSIQKAAKQTVSRDREEINVKTNSCFLGSYKVRREAVQPINLFNYTDFPNERCLSKCNKPVTETWLQDQTGYDALCERILQDIHTFEADWNNGDLPQLDTDLDTIPPIHDFDNAKSEEYESHFDLPLPSFINVDILF